MFLFAFYAIIIGVVGVVLYFLISFEDMAEAVHVGAAWVEDNPEYSILILIILAFMTL